MVSEIPGGGGGADIRSSVGAKLAQTPAGARVNVLGALIHQTVSCTLVHELVYKCPES